MHGIVFTEFKKFVTHRHGKQLWDILIAAAGFAGRNYVMTKVYPDEELSAIVQQACITFSSSPETLLEQFGEFIVPDLLTVYERSIDPSWTTLDLLENVETVIHHAVRKTNKGASPPNLKISRNSRNTLEIVYQSPRRLEHLGVGIIKGIAARTREAVKISVRQLADSATIITVDTPPTPANPLTNSYDKVSVQAIVN